MGSTLAEMAKPDPAPAAPKQVWQVEACDFKCAHYYALLAAGWEPFSAATRHDSTTVLTIFFRRLVDV